MLLTNNLITASDTDEYYQRLIQQGESARVEFKNSFQKELIETLVAFANSKGGLVLVGISDAGQITGVDIKAETLQDTLFKVNPFSLIFAYSADAGIE